MGAFDVAPNIVLPDPDKPKEAEAFRKKHGWEPHEQVLLKGVYTTADQEVVENASSTAKDEGRKQKFNLSVGSSRRRLLEVMIVDWTFAVNGRKIPVTPQSIGLLPSNYRDPILTKIDEIAVGMDEEEQQSFLNSANGHSLESSDLMSLSQSQS